uniref:Uncharacterized protein n=1 Tax=Arundo donax TaxID=35708 RepID=A0A0A9UKK5_ARUDO
MDVSEADMFCLPLNSASNSLPWCSVGRSNKVIERKCILVVTSLLQLHYVQSSIVCIRMEKPCPTNLLNHKNPLFATKVTRPQIMTFVVTRNFNYLQSNVELASRSQIMIEAGIVMPSFKS